MYMYNYIFICIYRSLDALAGGRRRLPPRTSGATVAYGQSPY